MARRGAASLACILLMLGGMACRQAEFLIRCARSPEVYVSRRLSSEDLAKELPNLAASMAAESAASEGQLDASRSSIAPGDCGELARHPVLASLMPNARLYVYRVRRRGWHMESAEAYLVAVSGGKEYRLPERVHQLLVASGISVTERNMDVWMRAVALVAISCRYLPAARLEGTDMGHDYYAQAPFSVALDGRAPMLPAVHMVKFQTFRPARMARSSGLGGNPPAPGMQAILRVGASRDTVRGEALLGCYLPGSHREPLWPLSYMDFSQRHGYQDQVRFDEFWYQ